MDPLWVRYIAFFALVRPAGAKPFSKIAFFLLWCAPQGRNHFQKLPFFALVRPAGAKPFSKIALFEHWRSVMHQKRMKKQDTETENKPPGSSTEGN